MFLKRCVLLVSYEEEPQDLAPGGCGRSPVIWHVKMRRQKEKRRKKKVQRKREVVFYCNSLIFWGIVGDMKERLFFIHCPNF